MKNYQKGKNVEEPWEKEKIPIPNLPADFLWMQVAAGSKLKNLLEYALSNFKDALVWSGSGAGLQKAISCAEIMKRKLTVHQLNRLCYRKFEEHWEPLLEGLEPLVVVRQVPTIHILLSKSPLDPDVPGIQRSTDVAKPKPAKKKKVPKRRNPQLAQKLKEFTSRK